MLGPALVLLGELRLEGGDDDAEEAAGAALARLELHHNRLAERSAAALAQAVPRSALLSLDVEDNLFSVAAERVLCAELLRAAARGPLAPLARARAQPSSCATATRPTTWARASRRRSTMLTA